MRYIQRTRTSWTLKHNIIINVREHEKMKYVSCQLCISQKHNRFERTILRALVRSSSDTTRLQYIIIIMSSDDINIMLLLLKNVKFIVKLIFTNIFMIFFRNAFEDVS